MPPAGKLLALRAQLLSESICHEEDYIEPKEAFAQPQRTQAEMAAARLVPRHLTEVNVNMLMAPSARFTVVTPAAVVTALAFVFLAHAYQRGACIAPDLLGSAAIERMPELGSMPPARELLALRAQLLSESTAA
jgi:hypothetical protein